MGNNSNPHKLDADRVRREGIDSYVSRATVLDRLPSIHSVRVNPRDENSPFVAPVLTPNTNSYALPSEGSRVMLLYITDGQPIVLGGIYLLDGDSPPDTADDDYVIGNESGSSMTVHEDGHISLVTEGVEKVDIDHQSASVFLDTDQIVSSNGYTKIEFDSIEDDKEGLFRPDTYDIQTRSEGLHKVSASIEIPAAGQNNSYSLAIFVNGVENKRVTRQSAINEPLSLQVITQVRLDANDVIDIRLSNNSGSDKTVLGSGVTTEFDVQRAGI